MGSYETDVKYAVHVLHDNDKSVVVSLDIEYDAIVRQKTGIAVNTLDIRGRTPFGMLGIIVPCLQRLPRVWTLLPEFSQGFTGYDAHGEDYILLPIGDQAFIFSNPFYALRSGVDRMAFRPVQLHGWDFVYRNNLKRIFLPPKTSL